MSLSNVHARTLFVGPLRGPGETLAPELMFLRLSKGTLSRQHVLPKSRFGISPCHFLQVARSKCFEHFVDPMFGSTGVTFYQHSKTLMFGISGLNPFCSLPKSDVYILVTFFFVGKLPTRVCFEIVVDPFLGLTGGHFRAKLQTLICWNFRPKPIFSQTSDTDMFVTDLFGELPTRSFFVSRFVSTRFWVDRWSCLTLSLLVSFWDVSISSLLRTWKCVPFGPVPLLSSHLLRLYFRPTGGEPTSTF